MYLEAVLYGHKVVVLIRRDMSGKEPEPKGNPSLAEKVYNFKRTYFMNLYKTETTRNRK